MSSLGRSSVVKNPSGRWTLRIVLANGHGGASEHDTMQEALDGIPTLRAMIGANLPDVRGPACDVRSVA